MRKPQPPKSSHQSPSGNEPRDARAARLAEALRANLARRKAQARARAAVNRAPGERG